MYKGILGTPPPAKRSRTNKSPPEVKKSHTETKKAMQSVEGNLSGAHLKRRLHGVKITCISQCCMHPFLDPLD